MIETNGLTKRYGPLTALDSLTLSVAPGETLGLLGPNGAGKTTTLRLLAGLTEASAGRVTVGGHDPWKEPDRVRRTMGVLPDGASLYDRLPVMENLRLFAGLYGVPLRRVTEALEETAVADLAGRPAGKLSRGQRQRVALARAILHQPRLLFLDEPTSGLDPAAAAAFHDLLKRLKAQGVTIVLSSHDMAEVDLLCDRVAILDQGRLQACDGPSRLKAAYGARTLTAAVETGAGVRELTWSLDAPDTVEQFAACQKAGRILSIRSNEATLGEVFVHLTGRKLA
ncbi:MAG TPA: ABC transporter ATP-binding protein [Symbiobacteriaceae bacterium]|nr:ABC transporter ATP-binding protein [Symbiobacteriaceae bacterium]